MSRWEMPQGRPLDTYDLRTINRLLDKFEITASGCWLWTGFIRPDGYGQLQYRDGKIAAHRLTYILLVGPVPAGKQLDHLCRVRACVNPSHLEPVTSAENTRRGMSLAAFRSRQTHCKRNHEFTPENTYVWRGSRICRACRSLWKRSRDRAARGES